MNHKVGIVMGSDSDLPTMRKATEMLEAFGIGFDVDVVSAHRTPQAAHQYATEAVDNGFEIIIAAAGGAAHLAGVIAALTPLPVIGVPMKSAALNGIDSLYSTVQMPSGVPVATMAIGDAGAKNAAVFAAEILGVSDKAIRQKVLDYREKLAKEVGEKRARVKKEFPDR